jgi:hypothetical protein
MAQHIESVGSSSISKVSAAEFWGSIRNGDFIFCSGADGISLPIEKETNSPFSHVLQARIPQDLKTPLALQSTIQKGVAANLLSEYEDYDGDLVLCRRPALTDAEVLLIQERFLIILDDAYNWKTEVGIVARNLLKCLPVDNPKNEYYCSGAQYYASLAVAPGLQRPSPLWYPTPEDNYTDPSVMPICALLKGAK